MQVSSTEQLGEVLWKYHHLGQPLYPADILLILGSHDLRIPRYGATLFQQGFAPLIVVTGGIAHTEDLLRTGWDQSEAAVFAETLKQEGVPGNKILLEIQAHHTGENFLFSRKLLESQMISFTSVLVVTKPFVERRAFGTGTQLWPDKEIRVTSPPLSFKEYCTDDISQADVLSLLVGYLQRLEIYGQKGVQTPQTIPPEVAEAALELRKRGFTKHLLSQEQIHHIHL